MDVFVTTKITIAEVEAAINYHRSRNPAGEDASLCKDARVLADLYGQMIFGKLAAVEGEDLSATIQASLARARQGS